MRKNPTISTKGEAYKKIKESWKDKSHRSLIIEALQKHQPCNNRKLSELTGLEIGSVTPITNGFKKKDLVKVTFARCPTTGYETQFFELKTDDFKRSDLTE